MASEQYKQLIEEGKESWEEGKIEAAIKAYEEAVAVTQQQSSWIYNRLGEGYQKIGLWDKAIAVYQKALTVQPEHLRLNLQLAQCYAHQGKLARATATYEKVIALDDKHPWAYLKLAELAIATENWSKAIDYYERGIEVNPYGTGGVYRDLLAILQREPNLDRAIAHYLQIAKENPNNAGWQILLGDLLQANEQSDRALDYYCQAKELGAVKPWFYRRLETVLLDLDRIDEVEELLQKLKEKYPDRPYGLAGLARVAMQSQQFTLAIERWNDVLQSFPDNISALVGKAKALSGSGNFPLARQEFANLTAQYPDSPEGLKGLANLATQQKEWLAALGYWDEFIAQFPDRPWFQVYRAKTLLQLERKTEARTIFQQITEQFPDKPEGWEGLAIAARLSGKLDLALEYCDFLQEKFPDFVGGYREKEEILIDCGDFQAASLAYLQRPFKIKSYPPKRQKLPDFPQDLVLPELRGINNDYSFIEARVAEFVASGQPYSLSVSILIPVYNRAVMLAKTLAALTHQTYPQDLIEVVVVDDGSSDEVGEVIRKYEQYLNLIYVRQADRGYRLAAARNLAARAARHDYLITIDCDILPYPQLVESYMKFFHVSDRAILIGHRRYACTDNITDDEILENISLALDLPSTVTTNEVAGNQNELESDDWRFPIYVQTNYKKNQRWYFRGFSGGNEAHPKKAIQEVGGYDEEFQHWGAEDKELGYRFYNAGYYFIPVMAAMSLHQEPPNGKNETDRQAGREITSLQLTEKCPVSPYRQYKPGKIYQVPKVSIYIPAYNREQFIKQAIDSALNQTYTDLEVVICNDGSTDGTLKVIEDNYSNCPRVRWISQPNRGIASASNTAVKMCRGMYIGQLDADDFLKPNAVELAVNYLDNNDVGYVFSSTAIVDRAGNYCRPLASNVEFSREALLLKMFVTHFRMYRKRDWCRTEGFDEEVSSVEDYDLALKMSEICHFYHLDSTNYCYRWHGNNVSLHGRREQEIKHLLSVNKALSRMGLAEKWQAVSASVNNARDIKLIPKAKIEPET